jgi:hypothetical protein
MNKRFFIVDINEDGSPFAFATDNLHKDFIELYKITWTAKESGDFDVPQIENVEVGKGYRVIYIFDRSKESNAHTSWPDVTPCIGEFNLFTEDFYDDLIDFIQEYWRIIEGGIDESISVKKFKDFN